MSGDGGDGRRGKVMGGDGRGGEADRVAFLTRKPTRIARPRFTPKNMSPTTYNTHIVKREKPAGS